MKFKLLYKVLFAFSLVFLTSCEKQSGPALSEDQILSMANAYYNNSLFEAAVREYLEYLDQYNVVSNKQANTYYIIANIYFERIKNYNKALEYYLRVKQLYPESSLQAEVGKRIVNCLERLERSQDAQRVLNRETALNPDDVVENKPGEVLAEIGTKKITQGDLDFEINQLPPYLQEQLSSREQKLEFLKQQIIQELLYDSAKRKGLDNDAEIIESAFRAKKGLMAQKILNDDIRKMVDLQEADVELYYKANMDKYAEKDDKGKVVRQKSLQEVVQQVAKDLMQERQQQAYSQLMERLMKSENVKIYENRLN